MGYRHTEEELLNIKAFALEATPGRRFVGGPFPAVTVCIEISPPYFNGDPDSYDPGHCEPLQQFWPGDRGEIPANVKADAELYARLDPQTVINLVDEIMLLRGKADLLVKENLSLRTMCRQAIGIADQLAESKFISQ